MAITDRPEDKFAFLFTGPTEAQDVKDIENVFSVLTESYGYPASQIVVVVGSGTNTPNVPGATLTSVADVTELDVELAGFAGMASGPAAGLGPGDWTTAVLYFTGFGDDTGLWIHTSDGGNFDPAWLQPRLEAITDCHVNVIMQQSYGQIFESALSGSPTLTEWSFTSATSATEQREPGDPQTFGGSIFTDGWMRACRLEPLDPGIPIVGGMYADQLGPTPQDTDLLVSLEEARDFSRDWHMDTGLMMTTPYYADDGQPAFLGKPRFEVRDGTPWWESPDIYLTHADPALDPGNEDLYVPDDDPSDLKNLVHVDVHNVGTHPVRSFGLELELCKTPGLTMTEEATVTVTPAAILFPGSHETYDWDVFFDAAFTHSCLRVDARLFAADVDNLWGSTEIQARDFKAQRNLDELVLAPPLPLPPPDADADAASEEFAELKGFMEHKYTLRNPFDERRRFALVIPPGYEQYKEVLKLSWFRTLEGNRAEIAELDVVEKPVPHLQFSLAPGESREVFLRVTMAPEFDAETVVRLPFEVLVRGDWPPGEMRNTAARAHFRVWAPFIGFTVVVGRGSSTLRGEILDREGRPAAGARVFLRTVDGRQGGVTKTDAEGRYAFAAINPNVYRVWTESAAWHSKEQTVVLLKGRETQEDLVLSEEAPVIGQRLKVILDKIRIMNDHDPCLKGKGELTFTSVVEPDNDASRKAVRRLPPTDVFHVGDKPGENEIPLGVTLFEGEVKNQTLSFSISGRELDRFDRDDVLNRYHRVFSGDPSTWVGDYSPTDEYLDREDVGDWALWYRIVPA